MGGREPKGEAMIVEATQAQVRSILGAMCRVAAPPNPADRAAIQAAYRYSSGAATRSTSTR
jgi:hypothetical protein